MAETTDNMKVNLTARLAVTIAIVLLGAGITLGSQLAILLGNVDRTEYVNDRSKRVAENAKKEAIAHFEYRILEEKYNALKEKCAKSD